MFLADNDNQDKVLLKIGEVSSVDPKAGTARVAFDDDDGLISGPLQIIMRNSFRNKDYQLPDVGEDVICLFLGTGIEEGFILGSVFAGDVMPAFASQDKRAVKFSDGSIFEFDRASSTMKVLIGVTAITATPSTVTVNTSDTETYEAATINVNGKNTVNINGGAAVNITTPTLTLTMGSTTMRLNGSSATIETSEIVLKGSMAVTGNLDVTGALTTTGGINAGGAVHGSNI